jgi:hypothetical protein
MSCYAEKAAHTGNGKKQLISVCAYSCCNFKMEKKLNLGCINLQLIKKWYALILVIEEYVGYLYEHHTILCYNRSSFLFDVRTVCSAMDLLFLLPPAQLFIRQVTMASV